MYRKLLALCVGPALLPGIAHSDPSMNVSLRYQRDAAADSCPDEQTIRRGVAARLGRDPFHRDAPRSIDVHITKLADGYAADIAVLDHADAIVGQRSLQSDDSDCAELAAAMQLSIAIAIDPLQNVPKDAPVEIAAVVPAPVPTPTIVAPPPPPPQQPQATQSKRYLGVGMMAATSLEPNLGYSGVLHYQRRASFLAYGAELRIDLPNRADAQSGQVRTSRAAAAAVLCIQAPITDLCAVASAGRLQATGLGFDENESVTTPYAALGARFVRHILVAPDFAIQFGLDLSARLNRTTLLVDRIAVWKSSPWEIAVGIRTAWRLP